MKNVKRVYVETLESLLFGDPLLPDEREKLSAFADREDGNLSLNECFEILEYGKILTPKQRELLRQHEEWLAESYELEQMDQTREGWL